MSDPGPWAPRTTALTPDEDVPGPRLPAAPPRWRGQREIRGKPHAARTHARLRARISRGPAMAERRFTTVMLRDRPEVPRRRCPARNRRPTGWGGWLLTGRSRGGTPVPPGRHYGRGMVTAWSRSGAPRFRLSAGSRRLLVVAMLLFGLVYAHGVHAEGVVGHLTSASTTTSATAHGHGSGGETGAIVQDSHAVPAEAAEHHEGEHDSSHPTQECLPGQPQQSPAMGAPSVRMWPGGAAFSDRSLDAPVRSDGATAPPRLRDSTGSGILRI